MRGKALVLGPTSPRTRYWMVKDAPIEVINGIRRGAPRSGRYAMRSMITATDVDVIIEARRTMRRDTIGLDVQSEVVARPLATTRTSPDTMNRNPIPRPRMRLCQT